jgi:hypothetical protein
VTDADAWSDCLTLVLRDDTGVDTGIVPWGNEHLLEKSLHPPHLLHFL